MSNEPDSTVVPAESLRRGVAAILGGFDVPPEHAASVAEVMVEADLRGVDSHGVHLVSLYAQRFESGDLNPHAEVTTIADHGTIVHLDAGLGLGQIAGLEAVRLVTERANEHGVAAVGVREGTHLGALAAYTERIAQQGLIAFCFQNGPTFVPPFGGLTPIFSTNPLSYAVPTFDEPTIVYDIATTSVAGNKVLLAKRRGDPTIPAGWANDEHGRPTTDTAAASVRNLQWFGGHKGFGLALLVEILAGALCDSSFGHTERTASRLQGDERIAKGFLFLAVDPGKFMDRDEFGRRIDTLARDVRAGERAAGVDRIWLPGEQEHQRRIERERHGVPVPTRVLAELRSLADRLGVSPISAG